MNRFLKSVRSPFVRKDEIIKQSITTNLSNAIKEIQYAVSEENKANKVVNITEATNDLCTAIEAMFLHGLRDSMAYKFKKALASIDEKPHPPDFWSPLLVISHKEIINQVSDLSQITTEVGQCRAWIRLALNDSLLSSYLQTIRLDNSVLKSYYNTNAYLRDSELLEVMQKLIADIEGFKDFSLPTNSSLLNNWQLQSLIMAGIWAPTLKNTPLAHCDDVAMIMDEDVPEISSVEDDTVSVCSMVSQSSSIRQGLSLSEDEVLKIILAKNDEPIAQTLGNCVSNRDGWSSETTVPVSASLDIPQNTNKPMDSSFTSLVESYNLVGGDYIRTPDIRGLWHKFNHKEEEEDEDNGSNKSISENASNSSSNHSSPVKSLASQLLKIPFEKGLDRQNFQCAGCEATFEGKVYFVCHFTGDYFCVQCMSPESIYIPARVIHNWDFKSYSVSQKSFDYLNEIKDHPIIDLKVVNPYIYGVSEEMGTLQILRTQLNFLRAYLYTCREPVIEQLQKQMWPREYMYEHIHQYSIADLYEIQNSVLAQHLQKVVKFGKDHVMSCWLCRQKGFLCEICNDPKPLFPFDVETVYRCNNCNAVSHKHCLNATKPCRKCFRRKTREQFPLPLFDS